MTYTELVTPGMKKFLVKVCKMTIPPNKEFAKEESKEEKQDFVMITRK